jgi:hypothetical protein
MNIKRNHLMRLLLAGMMVMSILPAMAESSNRTMPAMGSCPMAGGRLIMNSNAPCEKWDFDTAQANFLEIIDNHISMIEDSEDLGDEEVEELLAFLDDIMKSAADAETLEELRGIMDEMNEKLRCILGHSRMGAGPSLTGGMMESDILIPLEGQDFDVVKDHLLGTIDNQISRIEENDNLDDEDAEELLALLEDLRDSAEDAETLEELQDIMDEMREELGSIRGNSETGDCGFPMDAHGRGPMMSPENSSDE